MSQPPPPPPGFGGQPTPPAYPTVGAGHPFPGGHAGAGYPPPVRLRTDYARWSRRVGAAVIDFLPSWVALVPLMVAYVKFLIALTSVSSTSSTPGFPDLAGIAPWALSGGILYLAALGWQIYNRWLVGGRTGRSLGKRVLKIRLIGELTEQPIGALNAFARDLVHTLDGLAYVGYLWPLWDDKRQTFADMLMHTIVIDERPTVRAS